jgi:hypothetical protein
MMGRQTADQAALFYEFRLEDRVPEGHLLRRINVVIAPVFAGLHQQLARYYSSTGRPSIDPELMIRMLIIGLLSWHPLGATAMRGGGSQSGLSVVLPARSERCRA